MRGSCDWLLEISVVQSFLISDNSSILRIGGAPGSGKSTLAAFMVKHLMQNTSGEVLYFFCKGTDEEKKQPLQVLRTILSQLLIRDPSLYPWFETLYQQSGQSKAESFTVLHDSLLLALRSTTRASVYIVVDALDECSAARDIALTMAAAIDQTNKTVKVVLTSRQDPELLESIDYPMVELVISQSSLKSLIHQYVEQRVSRCRYIAKTELGTQVQNKVAAAADGLWLFARLMMDDIERLPSPASIVRQLENIPTGLSQLYMQIFSTMEKGLSPLELRLCQQVFLWIDMSEFVAAGRQHLDRELLDLILQAENSGESVFDSVELARQLCSPLVKLVEENPLFKCEFEGERFEVSFVHHTAAQFVRGCYNVGVKVPRILKRHHFKELYRGSTSVWYFEESPKSTQLLNQMVSDPTSDSGEYLEMAYGLYNAFYLTNLPSSLSTEDTVEVTRLCIKLTNFINSDRCLKWVEMGIIFNYYIASDALLHYANDVIDAAGEGIWDLFEPFRTYSVARMQFFTDYAYVLSVTGPCYGSDVEYLPEGFMERPLALQLLSIGERWKHL